MTRAFLAAPDLPMASLDAERRVEVDQDAVPGAARCGGGERGHSSNDGGERHRHEHEGAPAGAGDGATVVATAGPSAPPNCFAVFIRPGAAPVCSGVTPVLTSVANGVFIRGSSEIIALRHMTAPVLREGPRRA